MLGLGISLTRGTLPTSSRVIVTFNIGDRTNQGGVVYYTIPPDIEVNLSTTSYEAIPHSTPLPKVNNDYLYDSNNEDTVSFTTDYSRISQLQTNFKYIYNGEVTEDWEVVKRDQKLELAEDDVLAGWFNNIYLPNKSKFKSGLYFFPNQNDSTNKLGAIFSTDTELFYDNIDIDAQELNVQLVFGREFENEFKNVVTPPLTSPIATPSVQIMAVTNNQLLLNGFDLQTIASDVTYNQRYHKYTDYKEDLTSPDILNSSSKNREFRPLNKVLISETNKQITIQIPIYSVGEIPKAPWWPNLPIDMRFEIACMGPFAIDIGAGLEYKEFTLTSQTALLNQNILGENVYVTLRRFNINRNILNTLFIPILNKTVLETTYRAGDEDGDQRYQFLYYTIRNIRFSADGYLESPNIISNEMVRSILVPNVSNSLALSTGFVSAAIQLFNNESLKSEFTINPTAQTINPENSGVAYYQDLLAKKAYSLSEITTSAPVLYDSIIGAMTGDGKFAYLDNNSKQASYRVAGRIFSWWINTAVTFQNLTISLKKVNSSTNVVTTLESTELTPEDMQLIVRVTNEFADTYYEFDFNSTYVIPANELTESVDLVYLDIKIVPESSFVDDPIYTVEGTRSLQFLPTTLIDVQTYPTTSASPLTGYNLPSPTYYN